MFYKILIEPAKSDRSTCKNCKELIPQNSLRAKVVDAREFNQYIRVEGIQNLQGEGLSRGYFESVGPNGQDISIQKYFVHLQCYEPIEPHPFQKKYFQLKGLKAQQKKTFNQWLAKKDSQEKEKKAEKSKEKPKKKLKESDEKKFEVKKSEVNESEVKKSEARKSKARKSKARKSKARKSKARKFETSGENKIKKKVSKTKQIKKKRVNPTKKKRNDQLK